MTRNGSFHAARSGLLVSFALAVASVGASVPASAQVVERGIEGGVVGAIIGGIVGGGKGVGRGAAIGAGVGVLSGAMEADANARRRAYYGPPPPPPPGPGPGAGQDNLVYDIQTSLANHGYDPGPADGVMGQRTAEAISQYQYTNRLPVDGRPSPGLLDYMMRHGG